VLRSVEGTRANAPEERGHRAVLLLLILPVLCCGGPAIFAALAAASAATLGVVGGVIGAVAFGVAFGLFLRHRRRAACCAPVPAHKARHP